MKRKSSWSHIGTLILVVAVSVLLIGLVVKVVGDVNDKIDNIGSTTKKPQPTQTTATTIAPTDCKNHEYKDGVCIKCGTVCPHEHTSVSDNGNTYCTVCGKATIRLKIAAPVITLTGNIITFDAVPRANAYVLYKMSGVNDGYVVATNRNGETSFDLSTIILETGETTDGETLAVIAVDTTDTYLDSDFSNTVVFKWAQVFDFDYDIDNGYLLEGYGTPTSGKDFTCTIRALNQYTLPTSVRVWMGGEELSSSGYSYNSTTGVLTVYNVTGDVGLSGTCAAVSAQLAVPTGLMINDKTLSWNAVSGATGYVIRITSTEVAFDERFTAIGTTFDLGSCGIRESATYSIAVWARNDDGFGDAASIGYVCSNPYVLDVPIVSHASPLTVQNCVFTVTLPEHATGFWLYKNDELMTSGFTMEQQSNGDWIVTIAPETFTAGENKIQIAATCQNAGYADSNKRGVVTLTVPTTLKLDTPYIQLV